MLQQFGKVGCFPYPENAGLLEPPSHEWRNSSTRDDNKVNVANNKALVI